MTMTLITLQITIITYGICGWILQKTGMITTLLSTVSLVVVLKIMEQFFL